MNEGRGRGGTEPTAADASRVEAAVGFLCRERNLPSAGVAQALAAASARVAAGGVPYALLAQATYMKVEETPCSTRVGRKTV